MRKAERPDQELSAFAVWKTIMQNYLIMKKEAFIERLSTKIKHIRSKYR